MSPDKTTKLLFGTVLAALILCLGMMGYVVKTQKEQLNIAPISQPLVSTPAAVQPITPPNPEPQSQATTVIPGTENWKTYINKEGGYSIKYPEMFEINVTRCASNQRCMGGGVTFGASDSPKYGFGIDIESASQPLEEIVMAQQNAYSDKWRMSRIEAGDCPNQVCVGISGLIDSYFMDIAGQPGVRMATYNYESRDAFNTYFLTIHNNKLYRLFPSADNDPELALMLKTFQFID